MNEGKQTTGGDLDGSNLTVEHSKASQMFGVNCAALSLLGAMLCLLESITNW